jgi:hypothetical protein
MADHRDPDLEVHEEMLQPFKDQFYLELPPDPRIIDPARIRALRERVLSPYSHTWRDNEANFEIAEAIFGARRVSNPKNVVQLITDTMVRDENGHSTLARRPGPEFKLYPYITVAISTLPRYLHDYGLAAGLMGKLFPGFGYDYQFRGKYQRLRLANEDELGPWIESDYEPKMLVAAVLERLERYPEQAPQWRQL